MMPLETIKGDPRLWAMGLATHSAVTSACVWFMHRGMSDAQRRHEQQAKALMDALAVIDEHRTYIEHNINGRVLWRIPDKTKEIPTIKWPDNFIMNGETILAGVGAVLADYAQWLDQPHNIDYTRRANISFLTLLGEAYRHYRLDHPGIQRIREIHVIVMGSNVGSEDPDVLKAFRNGWQVSEETA